MTGLAAYRVAEEKRWAALVRLDAASATLGLGLLVAAWRYVEAVRQRAAAWVVVDKAAERVRG